MAFHNLMDLRKEDICTLENGDVLGYYMDGILIWRALVYDRKTVKIGYELIFYIAILDYDIPEGVRYKRMLININGNFGTLEENRITLLPGDVEDILC